jgi:tetratricopeptide (TPR) repeat protein
MMRLEWLSVLFALAVAPQTISPAHRPLQLPESILERPVALREGRGTIHEPVSTSSREAQAFYDQGLAYLHSYVWIEAVRSFHQALRNDALLAMAEVGLSYAEWQLSRPAAALAALDRALACREYASAHERTRIALRQQELDALEHPQDASRAAAYRQSLDQAISADATDVELWLLRGMAEAPAVGDRGQASPVSSIPFYERALRLAPEAFPAHHYLTHAFENADRIQDALGHGAKYASLAPAVPHAHHMYGHDLRRLGRIDDAIAEFKIANNLEVAYAQVEGVPLEFDWHHHHNIDLLATSLQYVGRMKEAEPLLKGSFNLPSMSIVQELNKREWPNFLIARGRTAEAAAAAKAMLEHPSPVVRTMAHVLMGRTAVASRQYAEAAAEANAALRQLRTLTAGASLVTLPFEELQGAFFVATGQRDKGEPMLIALVDKLHAQPGPDEWSQALFTMEGLARLARETGDWALARELARRMQAHDPAYAGTHYALALSAQQAGEQATAIAELRQAERLWHAADPDLRELLDIRTRLRQ